MCKILCFCTLPKRFWGGCLCSLYSMRARLPVEPLRSRLAQGNQGFLDEHDADARRSRQAGVWQIGHDQFAMAWEYMAWSG